MKERSAEKASGARMKERGAGRGIRRQDTKAKPSSPNQTKAVAPSHKNERKGRGESIRR